MHCAVLTIKGAMSRHGIHGIDPIVLQHKLSKCKSVKVNFSIAFIYPVVVVGVDGYARPLDSDVPECLLEERELRIFMTFSVWNNFIPLTYFHY